VSRVQRFDDEMPVTPRQRAVEAAIKRTPRKQPAEPIISARERRQEGLKAVRDASQGT
jgi:hypothetical protein